MLIEQKVESVKLSEAQQSVIDYILKERENIKDQTIKEIAKMTYTSTGTIIRLAKKLGYHGFEDFKEDFLKEVHYIDTHFQNIDPNYPFTSSDNMQKISSKVTALAQETLSDTLSLIEHDSLQKAIRLLRNAKHIHLAAISYSLLLGQMFQLDMMRIGVPVHICSIQGEELFVPAIIGKDDCMIFISYSGETHELIQIAQTLKEKKTPIIVLTSIGDNHLSHYADYILNIGSREKIFTKIAPFASQASMEYLLNVIFACIFQKDYKQNIQNKISYDKKNDSRHPLSSPVSD